MADRIAELRKAADKNGDGEISDSERSALRSVIEERMGVSKERTRNREDLPREPGPTAGFPEGANCLFIGHSFFVPVARSFDLLASASDFPRHKTQMVFSPGLGGLPGNLWENEKQKKKIEAILSSAKIEVFGMTTISGSGGTVDDYRKWIDLALKYNPDTKIMIGQFWMAGGPNLENEMYEQLTEMIGETGFQGVQELRQDYPNRIYYVHYGYVSSLMKSEFSAGNLPDITAMVGRGDEALFRDAKLGHAGPLMHELCAITWLAELYRAELGKISHSDFSEQAAEIALKGIQNNQQYR